MFEPEPRGCKISKTRNANERSSSTEAIQLAIERPSVGVLAAAMPICGGQIPKTQDT